MARILGLDLGSYALKALVIETTMRGFTAKQYLKVPVPPADSQLEAMAAALSELSPAEVDQILVAFPGVALATHPITLPFGDLKKVEQTLAFEIESQLPYDLEEAVYDYHLSSSTGASTNLLVGVMKKTQLRPLLEVLQKARVDPRVVTHSGLIYQSLIADLPTPHFGPTVAIVDIGHERVSVAIGKPGGAVNHARTFHGGGLAFTQALAEKFRIPLKEAEAWKETHGAVGAMAVSAESKRGATAILQGLQPILRELRPTLKAYAMHTKSPITQLLLCGGTAKLQGITEQLQNSLNLPVARLNLPEATHNVVQPDEVTAAQAVALAFRGVGIGSKNSRFNLRRGQFAFKSDFDFIRDKAGRLLAFAGVLLVLLITSGIIRNTVLKNREQKIDALLCNVTKRTLGRCEKDYTRALNLLQGQESPAAGIPKRSAKTLFAELTSRVPTELPITINQITIDFHRISLRCETNSLKNVEELITALKGYRCFQEIQRGRLEKKKDGNKVNFRLDIQVECPEDIQGAKG